MVLPGLIIWKVTIWLLSFWCSSTLAIKCLWLPWVQSVSWEAVPPVSPGRAGPWVWAAGRGASHDVISCTASDIDLICHFLAQTPSLSALLLHSFYSTVILSIFVPALCQLMVSTPYCTTSFLVLISNSLLSFLFLKSCTGLAPVLQKLLPSLLLGFPYFWLFDSFSSLIFKLDFSSLLLDPDY